MDKEKVINGLREMSCRATWKDIDRIRDKFQPIINNAITLLKEQEAVEPSFKQDKDGIFVWCCGSCGAYMYHIYDGIDKAKEYAKFCRQCGKPVLWGGR